MSPDHCPLGSTIVDIRAGSRESLRHHGDVDAGPGLLDFAVNVQGDGPPDWLRLRLADALAHLGTYPTVAADLAARTAVASRHGRTPEEVLLLAGGAEGFSLLPRLGVREAALIHPSFTEPEWALREAQVPVTQVLLDDPYVLDSATVPESADLVVIGNPTNPTSVLHPAEGESSRRTRQSSVRSVSSPARRTSVAPASRQARSTRTASPSTSSAGPSTSIKSRAAVPAGASVAVPR